MELIVNRLIKARHSKGQDKQEFADAVGLTRRSVSRWESLKGQTVKIRPGTLDALVEYTGYPAEYFINPDYPDDVPVKTQHIVDPLAKLRFMHSKDILLERINSLYDLGKMSDGETMEDITNIFEKVTDHIRVLMKLRQNSED